MTAMPAGRGKIITIINSVILIITTIIFITIISFFTFIPFKSAPLPSSWSLPLLPLPPLFSTTVYHNQHHLNLPPDHDENSAIIVTHVLSVNHHCYYDLIL